MYYIWTKSCISKILSDDVDKCCLNSKKLPELVLTYGQQHFWYPSIRPNNFDNNKIAWLCEEMKTSSELPSLLIDPLINVKRSSLLSRTRKIDANILSEWRNFSSIFMSFDEFPILMLSTFCFSSRSGSFMFDRKYGIACFGHPVELHFAVYRERYLLCLCFDGPWCL